MSASRPELPLPVRRAVESFAARLGRRFGERLASLRLFGSYARGDFGPDSDVDLLVVVDGLAGRERREVYEIAEEVYFDHEVHVSPLAHSREEYETLVRREYRIAAEIERDGVSL